MIVESEHSNATAGHPIADLGFRIEIERLVAQMVARIGAKLWPQIFNRAQDRTRIVGTTQSRLPRPRHAVINRGDPVADGLTVAFRKRDINRKRNARTGHQLPFKSVCVNVDNAWQHDTPGCIDATAISGFGTDSEDQAFILAEIDFGLHQLSIRQYRSALNSHDWHRQAKAAAPRGNAIGASYLSRNSSAPIWRKSGSALPRRSCRQFHHASVCMRAA